ncbi:hypothetical protein TUM4261_23970 [Shewanella sp. c952]|nr:hypothetical protein TUM4261_23970 [Shewanella sp. c952]
MFETSLFGSLYVTPFFVTFFWGSVFWLSARKSKFFHIVTIPVELSGYVAVSTWILTITLVHFGRITLLGWPT